MYMYWCNIHGLIYNAAIGLHITHAYKHNIFFHSEDLSKF
jgi:hypothetical protein